MPLPKHSHKRPNHTAPDPGITTGVAEDEWIYEYSQYLVSRSSPVLAVEEVQW